jgi:hypothetical protein
MTVYIKLLHGRDDPDQDMQDWGFAGPLLGLFEALHFTYRNHIRCISNSATEEELELGFTDDMLTYEGKHYGDFEIAAEFAGDTRKISPPRPQNPNPGRAEAAAGALRHYQATTGADYEDALGDLLADLMHWCDCDNFDFEAALFRARGHYEAETSGQDANPPAE